jgi:putative sterol carrier protein
MAIYQNSEQLYRCAGAFFGRLRESYPQAEDAVKKAKLLIRVSCTGPDVEFMINGRRDPVEIIFGSSRIRPEVEVEMMSDTLHKILLGELSLPKAAASKQMKIKGPVWKTFPLAELFERGQEIYPDILREQEVI